MATALRRRLAPRAVSRLALPLALCAGAWAAGCATPPAVTADAGIATPEPLRREAMVPRLGGDVATLDAVGDAELRRLGLVTTNLVSALVQLPELAPGTATLQVNRPGGALGSVMVRALEDAGYGLQLVDDDRGRRYVGYAKRVSETEVGEVTDYRLSVGEITLTREFTVEGEAIFPASLMRVEGIDRVPAIALADAVFAEQGGRARSFVSGTRGVRGTEGTPAVDTVEVFDYDTLPLEVRTAPDAVLERTRVRSRLAADAADAPDLDGFAEYRRTVLIFDDPDTRFMGAPNKRAVRLLLRDVDPRDRFVIRSCHDVDGRDEAAMRRGIRVEEELVGLGVAAEAAWIAPCVGASYRHASDDSPVAVELVHYRPAPVDDSPSTDGPAPTPIP